MRPPEILVTGGNGCLGRHLVERLVAGGSRVAVFQRSPTPLEVFARFGDAVETRHGDVCDPQATREAMRGIERVYHLAAVSKPLNRLEAEMRAVHIEGTKNVCRAAIEQGVKRIVHVSAAAAIGYPPPDVVASESFPFEQSVITNAYAETKRLGEQLALDCATHGFDVVVINPCTVIAPGFERPYGWAALMRATERGLVPAVAGGGSGVCTLADFIEGARLAMERGRSGERYLLSSANLTHAEVARLIAEVVGARPPRWTVPRWMLMSAGWLNAQRGALISDPQRMPILVPETVDVLARELYYDASKAVRELGLRPSPVIDALRHIYDQLRAKVDRATFNA